MGRYDFKRGGYFFGRLGLNPHPCAGMVQGEQFFHWLFCGGLMTFMQHTEEINDGLFKLEKLIGEIRVDILSGQESR